MLMAYMYHSRDMMHAQAVRGLDAVVMDGRSQRNGANGGHVRQRGRTPPRSTRPATPPRLAAAVDAAGTAYREVVLALHAERLGKYDSSTAELERSVAID